jgi:hypothetical protein
MAVFGITKISLSKLMKKKTRASLAFASTLTLTALLVACGGGGGGGSTTPPTSGGGGGSTPPPPTSTSTPAPGATTPPPGPTATPGAAGQLILSSAPLANATVVFTCGCNGDGGKITTDAKGNYVISGSAPSVLGNGTYTPTGHNLMIVGYDPNNQTQVWTMMFLGNTPAHNLNLSSTPTNATANVSDTASSAAALYVYYAAGTQVSGGDHSFDWFNFNTVASFAQHLRTAPNAAEAKFLTDITSSQSAGASLYPGFVPTWNPVSGEGTNATITADVQAIANGGLAADSTLPTPCPSLNGCANAPTP